jgi:hypothetical protein
MLFLGPLAVLRAAQLQQKAALVSNNISRLPVPLKK